MSTLDMAIVLGGVLLPNVGLPPKRTYDPNETEVRTLGGNLYTDYLNNLRTWTLSWDSIKREDFDIIHNLYNLQNTNHITHMLQIASLSIYVPVKIVMNPQDIAHNAAIIKSFSIILKETIGFS